MDSQKIYELLGRYIRSTEMVNELVDTLKLQMFDLGVEIKNMREQIGLDMQKADAEAATREEGL